MKIKKRTKPGVCDAMRCKEPASWKTSDGHSLCDRHSTDYDASSIRIDELAEPAPSAPKITNVSDDKAPSAEVIAEIVTPIKRETDETIVKIKTIEITNQGMLDTISKILSKVKADLKDLEARRKSVTKPLLDSKKEIDTWFKPATDSLKEAEKIIKRSIAAYLERKEQEKLAALATGNTAALAEPAPEVPEGIQTRATWAYRVVDEQMIPRQFMAPDHAEIGRVVREFKDKTDIPGIEVFMETSIAAKAAG